MKSTRWLRACGERPYRCFLRAWFVFTLISVALGFIGLSEMTGLAQGPPATGAIPYADFIAGGARARDGVLDLSPDELPPRGARDGRHWYRVVHDPHDPHADTPRLHTGCGRYIGSYGWPSASFVRATNSTWDVTDPSTPAVLVPDAHHGGVFLDPSWTGVVWTSEGGATAHSVSLAMPGVLLHLAVPQVLALLTVGSMGGFWRVRRRRRRRRGACRECGHALDPARLEARCPECGAEPTAERPSSCAAGRWAAGLFILLVTTWLIVQFTVSTDRPQGPLAERLGGITAAADELQRSFTKRMMVSLRSYGWPVDFCSVQVDQWYAVSPGQPPAPVAPTVPAGLTVDRSWLVRVRHHADPSFSTTLSIKWALAVLQIAYMQILVTILVGLCGVMRRRLSRRSTTSLASAARSSPR